MQGGQERESTKQPTPERDPLPRPSQRSLVRPGTLPPPPAPMPLDPGSPQEDKARRREGRAAGGTGTPQASAQVGSVPGVGAGGGARSPWR